MCIRDVCVHIYVCDVCARVMWVHMHAHGGDVTDQCAVDC